MLLAAAISLAFDFVDGFFLLLTALLGFGPETPRAKTGSTPSDHAVVPSPHEAFGELLFERIRTHQNRYSFVRAEATVDPKKNRLIFLPHLFGNLFDGQRLPSEQTHSKNKFRSKNLFVDKKSNQNRYFCSADFTRRTYK